MSERRLWSSMWSCCLWRCGTQHMAHLRPQLCNPNCCTSFCNLRILTWSNGVAQLEHIIARTTPYILSLCTMKCMPMYSWWRLRKSKIKALVPRWPLTSGVVSEGIVEDAFILKPKSKFKLRKNMIKWGGTEHIITKENSRMDRNQNKRPPLANTDVRTIM